MFAKGEIPVFSDIKLPIAMKVKKGIISSGDSFPVGLLDGQIMEELGTDAKDMEAAAVAEVAYLAGVPVFAVKSISDFIDSSEPTHHQCIANRHVATTNLAEALDLILSNNKFG